MTQFGRDVVRSLINNKVCLFRPMLRLSSPQKRGEHAAFILHRVTFLLFVFQTTFLLTRAPGLMRVSPVETLS